LESLDEYPCLDLDGVGSDFWPILATRLNLGSPAKGAPLAVDAEGGLAIVEWSPAFIKRFVVGVDPDMIEAVVDDLVMEQVVPGLDLSRTRDAVGKLMGFLKRSDLNREALVEYAAY
jgi:Arc/MetJ family transcription regulator